MSELAAIKALSRETKALIFVNEFEARRMPIFQLRAVLELLVNDAQEQKAIVDLVENDLRATGYPPEEISAFLGDLLSTAKPKSLSSEGGGTFATRKLKSPFAQGFEGGLPPADAGIVPAIPAPQVAPRARGSKILPAVPLTPEAGTSPAPPAPEELPFFGKSKTIAMGPPAAIPPASDTAPPQVPHKPGASNILPAVPQRTQGMGTSLAQTAPEERPFFGKGKTSMAGPPPADLLAPPAFSPPPQSAPAGSSAQRGRTFMLKPQPPPATVGGADALMPAGQSSLSRHDIIFGGKGAAAPPDMGPKPLILIADDDRRARMVFRIRIEEAGYETVECGTGDEAWSRIEQGGVALAVLDMKMPGLHGLEVLSNISEKRPGMPVVICTAYDQLQEEFAVKTYPKLKYLVKPIAPESLLQAIRELLGAKSTA